MSKTIERLPKLHRPEGTTQKPRLGFIRRHAVATYYALVFTISFGGIFLVIGRAGLFSTGATMETSAIALLLLGPPVACLLLTGLLDGRAGFRELGSRVRRWRVAGHWYAVALLTGPLVIGAALLLAIASPEYRPDIFTADDKLSILLVGIAAGLVGPFLEELGWAGFAMPRLRRRHGILTTGVVMGVLWGAWHFPLFAGDTDPTGTLPAPLLVAALLWAWLVPYRVLMVWVYDRTQSVLLAYLMHVPMTALVAILAPSEGISGIALITPVLVWGAAFSVLIAAVAWANGGHLTRRDEVVGSQEGVPIV